jgi:hypothetical protein
VLIHTTLLLYRFEGVASYVILTVSTTVSSQLLDFVLDARAAAVPRAAAGRGRVQNFRTHLQNCDREKVQDSIT